VTPPFEPNNDAIDLYRALSGFKQKIKKYGRKGGAKADEHAFERLAACRIRRISV